MMMMMRTPLSFLWLVVVVLRKVWSAAYYEDGRDTESRTVPPRLLVSSSTPFKRCVSESAVGMARATSAEPTVSLAWYVEAVDLERRNGTSEACLVRIELDCARVLASSGQSLAAARLARRAHARATGALDQDAAVAIVGAAIDRMTDESNILTVTVDGPSRIISPRIDLRAVAPKGDDVALRVCTYIDDYELVSCSFGAQMTNVSPRKRSLTARVYGLPSGIEAVAPIKVNFRMDEVNTVIGDSSRAETLELLVFTLVLNGMPFLTRHYSVLLETKLHFTWHVVEGLAVGRADAAKPYSSRPLPLFHKDGLSVDGTTEYLDSLSDTDPRVVVSRNCHPTRIPRCAWIDKIAMCNEALRRMSSSKTEVILMQIDADEIWSATQILAARAVLMSNQSPRCAMFHCHFLVGPQLATANGYGHSESYEWLRAWRLDDVSKALFISHAPPTLVLRRSETHDWKKVDVCLDHATTARAGAVFTHHAYVNEQQVMFKEAFYGYEGGLEGWRRLQEETRLPANLSNYLPWVLESPRFRATLVDIPAIAAKEILGLDGMGSNLAPTEAEASAEIKVREALATTRDRTNQPVVVIDCVAFQRKRSGGIRRVWTNVFPILFRLREDLFFYVVERAGATCVDSSLFKNVKVLSAPPFPESHDYNADALVLTMLCRRLGASFFLSTEYTAPLSSLRIRRVLLVHDLTPEKFKWQEPYWQLKSAAILNADSIVAVSNATATALKNAYFSAKNVVASSNGVDLEIFKPADAATISMLLRTHQVTKPYILMVGPRTGYKNGASLLRALYEARATTPHLWLVGGDALTADELALLAGPNLSFTHSPHLADTDLAAAYSGAVALAYLSRDEGFGLPILEALAAGCPVLASHIPAHLDLLRDSALPDCLPHNNCGAILVDPPDRLTAIWHAIRALLNLDQHRRASLRTSLRHHAEAYAGWNRLANDIAAQFVVS